MIDQSRRMIETGAAGGGCNFGSAGAILPNPPARNVMAIYEIARTYGMR